MIKEVAKDKCGRSHSCFGCITSNDNNIVLMIVMVMRRCALKVVASVCPVLTTNTRLVS